MIQNTAPDPSLLLDWYDRHRRSLPWRALPGKTPDPYAVWLSEIMLQQTTVQTVIPYYTRFLEHFPHVQDLAAAPQEDVLRLWAGLGYYARARNLHACAKEIARRGGFPDTVEALLSLPGIGIYTARAIAAIAFNRPVVPVDGNVERVTSRLYAVETPLPAARPELARLATQLNSNADAQNRASDFAQALFDLGATLCTPRSPSCLTCPWHSFCLGHARGIAATLPYRAPKQARPVRHGAHFRLSNSKGEILLRTRHSTGLLGGTDELPGTEWRAEPWPETEALTHAPLPLAWKKSGTIRHIFSHFTLYVDVYDAYFRESDGVIYPVFGKFRPIGNAALSSVMRKCLSISRNKT